MSISDASPRRSKRLSARQSQGSSFEPAKELSLAEMSSQELMELLVPLVDKTNRLRPDPRLINPPEPVMSSQELMQLLVPLEDKRDKILHELRRRHSKPPLTHYANYLVSREIRKVGRVLGEYPNDCTCNVSKECMDSRGEDVVMYEVKFEFLDRQIIYLGSCHINFGERLNEHHLPLELDGMVHPSAVIRHPVQ